MQTKHTPGDWHLGRRAAHVAIYGPNGEEIAVIPKTLDPDENLANARLIAAAPELLDALHGCLDAMRDLASDAGDVPEWNKGGAAHEAANAARAAIANATGTL